MSKKKLPGKWNKKFWWYKTHWWIW